MLEIEDNQQSAAESAEIGETEDKTLEGETPAPETEETDEEKNSRVQEEAAEKARQKEERRRASVQKRMDELTADKYAERKRADQLAEQNAKILALLEERQNPKAAKNDGEPTREEFESYEDFVAARAEYRAEKKVSAALEEFHRKQSEVTTERTKAQETQTFERQFMERTSALTKTLPDFQEVVGDWEPKLPAAVVDMVLRLPDGPLISYHMAKNPELEAQFLSQPEYMHGIILGQISASLKSTPKVSSAPAPGKPVASRVGSSSEPPSDPEQYFAWANKHLR
jgi:hypothetical protein